MIGVLRVAHGSGTMRAPPATPAGCPATGASLGRRASDALHLLSDASIACRLLRSPARRSSVSSSAGSSVGGRASRRPRGRAARATRSSSRASSDRSATGQSVFARATSAGDAATRESMRSKRSVSSTASSSTWTSSSRSTRSAREFTPAAVESSREVNASSASGRLRERRERLADVLDDRLDPRARLSEPPVERCDLVLLVGEARVADSTPSASASMRRRGRRVVAFRQTVVELLLGHSRSEPVERLDPRSEGRQHRPKLVGGGGPCRSSARP